MKLTISQSDLNHALKLVSRAVGSARMHPILCNVLLKASGGKLSATCYNIDLGINSSMIAVVESSGETTVPHKLLADIVSKVDRQAAINLELVDDFLTLRTPAGCYKIAAMSADDFPDLPTVADANAAVVSITEPLKAVLSCCSNDESKQVLTGIHLVANGEVLRLESTDGHRLSVRKQSCSIDGIDLLIPAKTMQQVLRVDSPEISIASDKHQVSIGFNDGTTIVGRVLDGSFPDVDKLIPSSFEHSLYVDRKALIDSLERLAIVSDGGNSIVQLKAADEFGDLSVTAECETGSGSESLMSNGTLPDLCINVHYLLDGIKTLSSNDIEIKANSSLTPVIIQEKDCSDNIYLVMPIQART